MIDLGSLSGACPNTIYGHKILLDDRSILITFCHRFQNVRAQFGKFFYEKNLLHSPFSILSTTSYDIVKAAFTI